MPEPVEVKQKPRAEERTTRTLPTRRDEVATAMGQWAGGPPKDKRMVVMDEGLVRKLEGEKREDESKTVVWLSSEVASAAWQQMRGEQCRRLKIWRSRWWRQPYGQQRGKRR